MKTYKKTIDFDSNTLTSFGKDSDFIDDIFNDIENKNGDLYVKLLVKLPEKLNARQKELVKELRDSF